MKKTTALAALTVGQLVVATCGLSPAFAQEKITISEVGAGSANHWPAYGAMERGYFKENGLEIDYISTRSSSAAMQELAAGSVDMGSGGLADPLRAIDQGAPISLLRIEAGAAPYEAFAKPTLHAFAELKGKLVMLGGPKDITHIYFERMASPEGLKPGSYDLIYAGATAARLAALASGSIDATILNPPFNFKAQAAGFSRLPAPADFAKGLPFTGYSVNIAWARSHQPLISGFLAAYSKGVDWFYDPKNRDEAVDVLVKRLKVTKDDAEKAYDFYVSRKVFDRHGAITANGLQELLKVLKNQGDIQGSADLVRFYKADLVPPGK